MLTLATATDANSWLDQTKLTMDNTDVNQIAPKIDAEVTGYMLNVFPTHAFLWLSGDEDTPAVIVDIVARLYAAAFYSKKYSEETLVPNSYAERLRNDAMALITAIQNNQLSVYDSDGNVILAESALEEPAFWPNDSTTTQIDKHGNLPVGFEPGDPDIAFTTDMIF